MYANEIGIQFVVQQRLHRQLTCSFIRELNLIAHCVCIALHFFQCRIKIYRFQSSGRFCCAPFKRCERAICSNNCTYLTKRTLLLNTRNIALIYWCHFSAAVFFFLCWFLLKTSVWEYWKRSAAFAPDSKRQFSIWKASRWKKRNNVERKLKNQTIEYCVYALMKCNCAGKWIVLQFIEKFVVTSATYNRPTTHTHTHVRAYELNESGNKIVISFNSRCKRKKKKKSISFSVCCNLTLFGNFATISFGKYWRMISWNTAYSTLIQWQRRMETPTFYTIAFGRKIKRENKERKKAFDGKTNQTIWSAISEAKNKAHRRKKKQFVCWSIQHRWFSWDAISHRIDEKHKF